MDWELVKKAELSSALLKSEHEKRFVKEGLEAKDIDSQRQKREINGFHFHLIFIRRKLKKIICDSFLLSCKF